MLTVVVLVCRIGVLGRVLSFYVVSRTLGALRRCDSFYVRHACI